MKMGVSEWNRLVPPTDSQNEFLHQWWEATNWHRVSFCSRRPSEWQFPMVKECQSLDFKNKGNWPPRPIFPANESCVWSYYLGVRLVLFGRWPPARGLTKTAWKSWAEVTHNDSTPMVRGHQWASGELLLTEGPWVADPYGKTLPLVKVLWGTKRLSISFNLRDFNFVSEKQNRMPKWIWVSNIKPK